MFEIEVTVGKSRLQNLKSLITVDVVVLHCNPASYPNRTSYFRIPSTITDSKMYRRVNVIFIDRYRGLRLSLQRKILIQLCISMLGLYLAFLIGIDSTHSEIGCLIVAACLHYFVVTTILWMGVEARHMYITLVSETSRISRKFMIKASLFAWGKKRIATIIFYNRFSILNALRSFDRQLPAKVLLVYVSQIRLFLL